MALWQRMGTRGTKFTWERLKATASDSRGGMAAGTRLLLGRIASSFGCVGACFACHRVSVSVPVPQLQQSLPLPLPLILLPAATATTVVAAATAVVFTTAEVVALPPLFLRRCCVASHWRLAPQSKTAIAAGHDGAKAVGKWRQRQVAGSRGLAEAGCM